MIFQSNLTGKTVDVNLDPTKRNVIAMSGGADSTLLLHLIGLHNPDIEVEVVCADVKNKGGNTERVKSIIKFVEESVGRTVVSELHSLPVSADSTPTFEIRQFAHNESDDNFVFVTGLTCAPPADAVVSDLNGVSVNLRESCQESERLAESDIPTKINIEWGTHPGKDISIYAPMANVDKLTVYSLYRELEVAELYDLTRSCETEYAEECDNFKSHCNLKSDWWCMERKWAEEEYARKTK